MGILVKVGVVLLQPDSQGSVLVRKGHSEYPASQGRPATAHDDLIIVCAKQGRTRAIYFDNEGHVINYTSSFPQMAKRSPS